MKLMKKTGCLLMMFALLVTGCGQEKQQEDGIVIPKNVETTTLGESIEAAEKAQDEPGIEMSTEDLPIGTIVKIQGDESDYMITAKNYALLEVKDITFDYALFAYPVGNTSGVPTLAVNKEDIEKVIYSGLKNENEALKDREYEASKGQYLPIGTVVTVKDVDKPIMVVGRHQTASDGTIYTYSGYEYPTGFTTAEEGYLFTDELIETIQFYGYCNPAEIEMEKSLAEMDEAAQEENSEAEPEINVEQK